MIDTACHECRNIMENDDTDRLVVWIEDIDGSEECPSCGHDFDHDETVTGNESWDDLGGYHYRSGGKTTYGCPVEGCDGKIEVTI